MPSSRSSSKCRSSTSGSSSPSTSSGSRSPRALWIMNSQGSTPASSTNLFTSPSSKCSSPSASAEAKCWSKSRSLGHASAAASIMSAAAAACVSSWWLIVPSKSSSISRSISAATREASTSSSRGGMLSETRSSLTLSRSAPARYTNVSASLRSKLPSWSRSALLKRLVSHRWAATPLRRSKPPAATAPRATSKNSWWSIRPSSSPSNFRNMSAATSGSSSGATDVRWGSPFRSARPTWRRARKTDEAATKRRPPATMATEDPRTLRRSLPGCPG
mmetsp:Transcript_32/g.85  ORF Transcript_32/g.85 Transcript_32/m.85 type:complete len:275 (-) Transcript_32:2-826(-)